MLHLQILNERLADAAKRLQLDLPKTMMRYGHALSLGSSFLTIDSTDIVDGNQEKQIDAFTIRDGKDESHIFITQTKHSASFGSNDLVLLKNGLTWLFEKSREELQTLTNRKLRTRIEEFRDLLKDNGPSTINLHVAYITIGDTSSLSAEFEQELRALRKYVEDQQFGNAEVDVWGSKELVARADEIDRERRKIDRDIRIYTDRIHTSAIEHHVSNLKGVVCTVAASELAELVNSDSTGFVFDWNIRQFLGMKGSVNTSIKQACSAHGQADMFWFLNNGITIVADSVEVAAIPGEPLLKLKNLQIVNGCQTASVLAAAASEGILSPSTHVLVRAYETGGGTLIEKIVESTNTQNKITTRNLKANDRLQIEMETAFKAKGFYYERKTRQYDRDATVVKEKVFANEEVGQAYLATALRRPSDAGRRKYRVWDELYPDIFCGAPVETYLASTSLVRRVREWLESSGLQASRSEARAKIARAAAYHVAFVSGILLDRGEGWITDPSRAASLLAKVRSSQSFPSEFQSAFEVIARAINSEDFAKDLDQSLRSAAFDVVLKAAAFRTLSRLSAAKGSDK